MCGRYTLTYADLDEVARLLAAIIDPAAADLHHPRYNIAPTTPCVIARASKHGGRPLLVAAVWGIRLSGRLVFNARTDTIAARFPAAFAAGRCVVPADGFYEWRGERDARRPIWFHAPASPLFMAAIAFDEPSPGAPPPFTVLTVAARPPVAEIHDRMPLLLSAESARRWIERPPQALRGDDIALLGTEVSPRVNAVANDDPACLTPATNAPGQLRLF